MIGECVPQINKCALEIWQDTPQPAITSSKLTIETLEQCKKYVQS